MRTTLALGLLCGLSILAAAQQQDLSTSQEPAGSSACHSLAAGDEQMVPLARVCEFALTFHAHLPDFTCGQTTVSTEQWKTHARVVEAQVTYLHGKEQYSDVSVNGIPSVPGRVVWLTHPLLSTRGEFGSDLVYLFTPPITAEFKFQKQASLRAQTVSVYEIHLPADKNTFWTLYDAKGQSVKPELRGELWVEPQPAKLVRLRLEPVNLPFDFGIKNGTTTINYAEVKLGDAGEFLLPVRSETDACLRGYNLNLLTATLTCLDNVVTFHDCHKFAAKSSFHVVH